MSELTPTVFRQISVTKVRGGGKSHEVRGWLVSPLSVGGRMVVRQDDDRQLTSTAIRRMLVEDPDAQVVYIETQNSAYRIKFTGGDDEIAPPAVRVRVDVDDDSREITLVEELSTPGTQPRRS
ncbi:MAG: hypothetical protein JWN44_6936 [Myxococcales bacterium]|nr:hypothetical protein [Myxococcales bacterium]